MEASRSSTPVQQYTSNLDYPESLADFSPPDVSGTTKFNEVAAQVTAYVQANKPRLEPLLDYASTCSGRVFLLLSAATRQHQRRSEIEPRKMELLQRERNDYVSGVEKLEREVTVLTAVVKGLQDVDEFLNRTIIDNTGVVNTKFAAMDVKASAEANLTTAKKLQEVAQSMHACLQTFLDALGDRTAAAHKQVSKLITCLDTNRGAPFSAWQKTTELTSGATAKLTYYTPKEVAGPANSSPPRALTAVGSGKMD